MKNWFTNDNGKPKTEGDEDFLAKVEELKYIEASILDVKRIWNNFNVNTRGIKEHCRDVYTSIRNLYSSNSSYFDAVHEISLVYQEMERLYEIMVNILVISLGRKSSRN